MGLCLFDTAFKKIVQFTALIRLTSCVFAVLLSSTVIEPLVEHPNRGDVPAHFRASSNAYLTSNGPNSPSKASVKGNANNNINHIIINKQIDTDMEKFEGSDQVNEEIGDQEALVTKNDSGNEQNDLNSNSAQSNVDSNSPNNVSPGSSSDAAFAFESALLADVLSGKSLKEAVHSLFDSMGGASESVTRIRMQNMNLAAPIIGALEKNPELNDDIHTIASMCQTVYEMAEDEIHGLRNAANRPKFPLTDIQDVARLIEKASKVILLTGAGVSVSCGIPDFRSKGGIYDTVQKQYDLPDPHMVFDLDEFEHNPGLFYSFAKHIMPSSQLRPSATHRFIAELSRRGKLLRDYSQNIDGLERRAGVPADQLVLCHGSFLTAQCMVESCSSQVPGSSILDDVKNGVVPRCKDCIKRRDKTPRTQRRHPRNERKNANDDGGGDNIDDSGVMKPDIIFFGEPLPPHVDNCMESDVNQADLVLVLGTSMKVNPIASLPRLFRDDVPRILVNREVVNYEFDVELMGDCDVVVHHLRSALGWNDDDDGSKDCNLEDGADDITFVAPKRFLFKGAEASLTVDKADEPQ